MTTEQQARRAAPSPMVFPFPMPGEQVRLAYRELHIAINGIAAIYSADAQVVSVAASLLAWLALFHLGDATQALCVFVLRCYRVTVAPLVAYSLLLWGVGLTGGFALAYRGLGLWPPMNSPAAFWMASSFALGLLAFILPSILWRAVRRYEGGRNLPAGGERSV